MKKRVLSFMMLSVVLAGTLIPESSLAKEKELNIKRFSGGNRFDTSVKVSEEGVSKSKNVVIANGEDFPDVLSEGAYIAKNKMPIVLADNSMPTVAVNKDRVIFGGNNTINFTGLTGLRLYGGDRYETAVKIAEYGFDSKTIILASGENYADALSAISLADKEDAPILLTAKNTVGSNVLKFIKNNKIENVLLVGGEGSISENIVDRIEEYVNKEEPIKPTEPKEPTVDSNASIEELRKAPLLSLSGEQAMKLYNAQEDIDSSKDIMTQKNRS